MKSIQTNFETKLFFLPKVCGLIRENLKILTTLRIIKYKKKNLILGFLFIELQLQQFVKTMMEKHYFLWSIVYQADRKINSSLSKMIFKVTVSASDTRIPIQTFSHHNKKLLKKTYLNFSNLTFIYLNEYFRKTLLFKRNSY